MSESLRFASGLPVRIPVLVIGGRHPEHVASLVRTASSAQTTAVVIDPSLESDLETMVGPRVIAGPITVELDPGDVTTALRWDVLREIEWLVTAPEPPARIVVGLGHDADLVTVGQSLLGDARVRESTDLERFVVAIRADDLDVPAPWMSGADQQVEVASWSVADDLVVFGDRSAERRRAAAQLRSCGVARRVSTDAGLSEQLLRRVQVRHSVAAIAQTAQPQRCHHRAGGALDAVEIVAEGDLDADHVEAWLEELLDRCGQNLAMLEARLAIAGEPDPWVIRGFRATVEVTSHPSAHHRRSYVRIVGSGVDGDRLADDLASCRRW